MVPYGFAAGEGAGFSGGRAIGMDGSLGFGGATGGVAGTAGFGSAIISRSASFIVALSRVLGENRFANPAHLFELFFCLQRRQFPEERKWGIEALRIIGRHLLIGGQGFIRFT